MVWQNICKPGKASWNIEAKSLNVPYNRTMLKDAIVRFDTTVTAFVQHGPSWLQAPMLVITNTGQPLAMALLAAAVCVFAWQHKQMNIVYSLTVGVLAMGANGLLKHYIHRPRPDTLYASNMYFKTSSFPSGHAFGAAVILGILAYLAASHLPAPWNIVLPILLGFFIVAIGISRVYLGAHYPTDVIAGWILGLIAAALIIIFFKP